MKSKHNIKIVISVVSIIIFIFLTGCSTGNKNANNESSIQNSNSNNNKSSDTTSPSNKTNNSDLMGTVTEVNGNKINITKTSKKSNGVGVGYKKGSPEYDKSLDIFEVTKDTNITVRTVSGKGAQHSVATDSAGSISDIKVNSFVEVWTKKDGSTVTASKVIVSIFN